jgi:hypothetical protein
MSIWTAMGNCEVEGCETGEQRIAVIRLNTSDGTGGAEYTGFSICPACLRRALLEIERIERRPPDPFASGPNIARHG